MIYLTRILSLDIRERLISIAYIGRTFKGAELIESAVVRKEPMKESGTGEGESDYDPMLLDDLRAFIEEKKISPEETVICLPRNSIMFNFVDLPSPDKASIPDILRFELDRLLPVDPSDIYYDYKVLGEEKQNHFKILLVAASKRVVDYYIGLLREVGLPPTVLDVSTFGSFYAGYFSDHDLKRPMGIIDVSARSFEIILVEDDSIRFSRSVKIDNEGWAECFFNGREFIKAGGREIEHLTEDILKNFRRSVEIAGQRDGGPPPESILLLGGGQSDQILFNYLEKKSDLEVEALVPSERFFKIRGGTDGTNSLLTAIGLGLGELKKCPMKINLLPDSLRAKRKRSHIIMTFALLGLILLSSIGIAVSSMVKDRLTLADLEAKLKETRKKVVEVERMELSYESLYSRMRELRGVWGRDIRVLEVIKELTQLLPKDTHLTALNIKGRVVEVSGRSASASSLIPILDNSPMFKDVRFAGSVESRDGAERFKIKMTVEKL